MKNTKTAFATGLVLNLLFVFGCASPGPKFSDVRKDVPAIRAGQSRVFAYRTSVLGAAIQPEVRLNGMVIGTARPNVVTFIDVQPGTYQMATTTEKTNEVSFTLVAGETKYLKLVPYMGFLIGHIDPQVMKETEGEEDIRDLALVIAPQMKGKVPATLLPKE